jgi:hypothetical protein
MDQPLPFSLFKNKEGETFAYLCQLGARKTVFFT